MSIPDLPNTHAMLVLALVVLSFFMFTREKLPIETSALIVLTFLTLSFELFPLRLPGRELRGHELLLGFGHEALVAICALMILGRALEDTGALAPISRGLATQWNRSPIISMLLMLLTSAFFSAFLNNISIVIMLMPILLSVASSSNTSASRSLMPMGLATLLGGMATTIGTSTNLLVVTIAAELDVKPFGMFDFALPVVIVGSVGLIYLWLIAPHILPDRKAIITNASPRIFHALLFVVEGRFSDGKRLQEILERTANRMRITEIERGDGIYVAQSPSAVLRAGDRLHVSDSAENLKEFEHLLGCRLHNVSDVNNAVDADHPLKPHDHQLAELVVTENSMLDNSTLRRARFAERFGLVILALHRKNGETNGDISNIALAPGDLLLAQGTESQISELKKSSDLLVLDDKIALPVPGKAPLVVSTMICVISLAVSGILPISLSALAGVVFVIATKCIGWQRAASALSTPVVLLIVATLALGTALTRTGGADYLAGLYVFLASGLPPSFLLSTLMLLMILMTNVVSTSAAAVIGTPIAVSIAQQLNVAPEPFVLAVLFGVNMSYATPIAHKTNLLIFSVGGYTFGDFLRVGIPLTLIMWIGFSIALPIIYDL